MSDRARAAAEQLCRNPLPAKACGNDEAWVEHTASVIRSHFPADEELLKDIANVFCNACQILDVVKWEWAAENCWSEWDESVRESMSAVMRKIDERLRAAIEAEGKVGK